MSDKKKRIIRYAGAGLLAIGVASLFVTWSNPLDRAVQRLLEEEDLTRLNAAATTDRTGYSMNMYAFKPGQEESLASVQQMLTVACRGCSVSIDDDYLLVTDSKDPDKVRLEVEYKLDPGWQSTKELGAILIVTHYGPPRRTIWDWLGRLFV